MAMRGLGSGRTHQDGAVPQEATPNEATTAKTLRFVPGPGNRSMVLFFSAVWLFYLLAPVSGLFGHRHGVAWIVGGLVITLAFCIVYIAALVDWGGRARLGRGELAALPV